MQKHTIDPVINRWNCSNFINQVNFSKQQQNKKTYTQLVRQIPVNISNYPKVCISQELESQSKYIQKLQKQSLYRIQILQGKLSNYNHVFNINDNNLNNNCIQLKKNIQYQKQQTQQYCLKNVNPNNNQNKFCLTSQTQQTLSSNNQIQIQNIYQKRFLYLQQIIIQTIKQDEYYPLLNEKLKHQRLKEIINQSFFTQKQILLLEIINKYQQLKKLYLNLKKVQKQKINITSITNIEVQNMIKKQKQKIIQQYQQVLKKNDEQIKEKSQIIAGFNHQISILAQSYDQDKKIFESNCEKLLLQNQSLKQQIEQFKKHFEEYNCKSCQIYLKQIQCLQNSNKNYITQVQTLKSHVQKYKQQMTQLKKQQIYQKQCNSQSSNSVLNTDKITEALIQKQNQKIKFLLRQNNQLKQQLELNSTLTKEQKDRLQNIQKLKKKIHLLQNSLTVIKNNFVIIRKEVIQVCLKQIHILKKQLLDIKKIITNEFINTNGVYQKMISQYLKQQIQNWLKYKNNECQQNNHKYFQQLNGIDKDLKYFIQNCINT